MKEKSTIRIKEDYCWVCGKDFVPNTKKKRTYHHTIPQRFNPLCNLLLPICWECHEKINNEEQTWKKKYDSLKSNFTSFVTKINGKIAKYEK